MTDYPTLVDFLLARLDEDEAEDRAAVAWRLLGTTKTVAVTFDPNVEVDVPGDYDLVGGRLPMTGIRREVVELCVLPWLTDVEEGAELAGRILYAMCAPYRTHPDYAAAVLPSRERSLTDFPPSHLAKGRPVPAVPGARLQAKDGTWWVAEGPTSWTEVPADGSGPLQLEAGS
jgi:hypothetical protein